MREDGSIVDGMLPKAKAIEDAIRGGCLLYTSDAADERSSVDLGGRRSIQKKKKKTHGVI